MPSPLLWLKTAVCLSFGFPALLIAQTNVPDEPAATPAVAPGERPRLVGNTLVLMAEQSVGGTILRTSSGELVGVTLDRDNGGNVKETSGACIEWTVAEPIPAGWWHGVLQSNAPAGYANREFSVMFMSGQKPGVVVAPNYTRETNGSDPRRFEFWIHVAEPTSTIRLQPQGRLRPGNKTWPVSQLTLVQGAPKALTDADAVTLELTADAEGRFTLPASLPMGLWSASGLVRKEGKVFFKGEDGRENSFPLGQQANRTGNFYMDSPLGAVRIEPTGAISTLLLRHNVSRPAKSLATDTLLLKTVDYDRTEEATLELIGAVPAGELPTLPPFPQGRKIAVLTTWDDGFATDLRAAQVLNKLGYRPSFFMNRNSEALKFLDELVALNVEIGSHCFNHPSLHSIPPQSALEECAEMRKVLEQRLGHPVISFAYPNGYTPAYDMDGDYVLRAVEKAGYWSGRSTLVSQKTVDSITQPLTWKTNGFFSDRKDLERAWSQVKDKEGAVFYFWGHSWQIGKTEKDWEEFEAFVAQFANQPQAWYASQGELSLWLWSRKNVRLTVAKSDSGRTSVTVTRPWLHPWLSERAALSFKVPTGVQKVLWRGRELPVKDGVVDFVW